MTAVVRCVLCSSEFNGEALDALPPEKHGSCPACGTRSLPMDPEDDVTVAVNWHELRILCIWAENWAAKHPEPDAYGHSMSTTVRAIARRLCAQHPERVALTLSGEVAALVAAGFDAKLVRNGDKP